MTKGGFSSFIILAGGSFRLKKLAVQGMAPAVQIVCLHHATCWYSSLPQTYLFVPRLVLGIANVRKGTIRDKLSICFHSTPTFEPQHV